MDIKNPFGLRKGEIVTIEDLCSDERGLACDCRCPACNGKFEARLGNVRVHHFAHSGDSCDEVSAFLIGMYKLIKQILDKNKIILPHLDIYWAFSQTRFTEENFFSRIKFRPLHGYNKTRVYSEKEIKFDSSEIIFKNNIPIAIVLSYKESKIALRIKPPATVCREFETKPYENIATLSFDAEDIDFSKLNINDITKIFLTELDKLSWIYTERALKAIDQINKENDIEQERIQKELEDKRKKLDEEIRLQEEKRKKPQKSKTTPIHRPQAIRITQNTSLSSPSLVDYSEKKYRVGYEEVKDKDFASNSNIIYDIFGHRWVKCKICGKIDYDSNFPDYGGPYSTNLGECRECSISQKLFKCNL